MKKIVVIGATSGMATACCRLWAQAEPTHFYLVARNAERLARLKNDLETRAPQCVFEPMRVDFLDPAAIAALVEKTSADSPIDLAFIAHGTLPAQEAAQNSLDLCKESLEINALSPVLFMEAFAQKMEKTGFGKIAVISSVAGDRGRKSIYIYGAAKGLITRYAQGLQHRFAGSNIHIILIKPGPTNTPMTANLPAKPGNKRTNVNVVASQIVAGIAKNRATIYTPPLWALIMWIIRHLPAFVFNKLNI